ncbi:MFS transporter [Actinoplanes sp. G11-F43]|uniref:MFS transporter n=1 Tax=Actinoplanes sp. G11-F43 TaxID=3424130 RepID=UPI003D3572E1
MVRRGLAFLTTLFVLVVASIAWAVATPTPASAAPPPGQLCSVEEWQKDMLGCVKALPDVADSVANCLKAPSPNAPDSGFAGWFAERPPTSARNGPQGFYSTYGYAGYSYTTYDLDSGCASTLVDPDFKVETTIANGEFMIASAIIGASNALRERAWDPQSMWSWADPLVEQTTKAIYEKVFTVFGTITLAVIGIYLIWRSRQAEMGAATTTVGWALLVMVAVTAIVAWPVKSASIADQTLVTGLSAVHDTVGPRPRNDVPTECRLGDPEACKDQRSPAVRASDTGTETILYRNWIRGILGSADSVTAQKYGLALYNARALSWSEAEKFRANPNTRDAEIQRKNNQWHKVAAQIKIEDPEAYQYLQGVNGIDRIGAGFIAMLAAFMYALFDITASILVLLGFLIFRWAVIAAPLLGTVGLLRPASGGIRRLGNAVVAAVFNIAIFGTGAAIYLFAVDLIMNTSGLPGWLQVVLVGLCGVAGWLLLRPYRRITQLGGKDGARDIATGGSWQRRFFRDAREAAKIDAAEGSDGRDGRNGRDAIGKGPFEQRNLRPEARLEDPAHAPGSRGERTDVVTTGAPTRPDGRETTVRAEDEPAAAAPSKKTPARRGLRRSSTTADWTEPDVSERPSSYAIYRPETRATTEEPAASPRVRSEAR